MKLDRNEGDFHTKNVYMTWKIPMHQIRKYDHHFGKCVIRILENTNTTLDMLNYRIEQCDITLKNV